MNSPTDHNELQAGYKYRDIQLCISPELQEHRLQSCLIDPSIYHGFVDLTHFCNEAILAATKSGLSINGNVHTTDRIMCTQRVSLNQPLVMSGEVTRTEPVARGTLITSVFTFTLPDGTTALKTERTSTRLHRDGSVDNSIKRQRQVEPDLSTYETVAQCSFAPDRVADYSSEGGNAIHYDPGVAAQFGYRAPIAGGLMGVRSLMATLCLNDGPPNTIDISIRFRRPMFWDETLDVMQRRKADGAVSHLALINASGKAAVEAKVEDLA
ncbi:MAG: hypothetical protein AAGB04_00530 [Pseudomonadota bacterium]